MMTFTDFAAECVAAIEHIAALAVEMERQRAAEQQPGGDVAAVAAVEAKPATAPSSNAERQRRYRERHSTVTEPVTRNVTTVTEVTDDRNAALRSRAVVQEQKPLEATTGNNGSISSYSSSKTARAQFGNIQQAIESVTRNATRDVTRNADVTGDVTPIVTEPLALSVTLGKEPTEKLKALFKRHDIHAAQREPWLRVVAAMFKDKTFHPADVSSACDDDELNPITKGPLGFRSFITAARDKRLRTGTSAEQTEVARLMTKHNSHIEARRYSLAAYGESWWNWCQDGATRDGLPSPYHFAALHFDDPWPQPQGSLT